MQATNQLDLFSYPETPTDKEQLGLHRHWKNQLSLWITRAFAYRHSQHTTGWSMALQGHVFAVLLHRAGEMTEKQFAKYMLFAARLDRINKHTIEA